MATNPGEAIRRTATAQTTGGEVRLIDNRHPDAPAEVVDVTDRWSVVCEHDLFITTPARRAGRMAMPHPETWCEKCAAQAVARGYSFDEVSTEPVES